MTKKKEKEIESLGLSDVLKKLVVTPDQAVQKLTSMTGDISKTIKAETKKYLDKLDLSKEIEKILEKYDFEVNATIRLKKKEEKQKNKKS